MKRKWCCICGKNKQPGYELLQPRFSAGLFYVDYLIWKYPFNAVTFAMNFGSCHRRD
jgi:hypothetical protein